MSSIDLSSNPGIQNDITTTVGRFQVDSNGIFTFSPKVTFTGTTSIQVRYTTTDNLSLSTVLYFQVIPQEICSQNIQAKSFETSDGVKQIFNMPATDYGFQFDIYSLDNSFNLTINGTPLITDFNYETLDTKRNELEFQSNQTHNVTFDDADNNYWGYNGIPEIYNMVGNANNPILRV